MSECGGPYDLVYVHTDIPEGMTIRQWRGRSIPERLSAATDADHHQRRARRTRRWRAALRMPVRRIRTGGRAVERT